jgi:predicted small integral membrane protein
MPIRLSKTALVATIALWVTLVAFGNITDYGTNLAFVQHVLAMDTIFPDSAIRYRAIHAPWLQHAAYILIIVVEVAIAALCWLGTWRMWRNRHAPTTLFRRAKRGALAGLVLGIALWLGGFMAIGGEWFGMWMSAQWNGIASAFRFAAVLLLALVFVAQRNDELAD